MKGLVLLGEGHGEESALPILIRRLLNEKGADNVLYVDDEIIRDKRDGLVKWDKSQQQPDFSKWVKRVEIASRRRNVGAVLAVYDGDAKRFPAGSPNNFCAATAARMMASAAARHAGAGKLFSLSVVFACSEFESWLVASASSFAGRPTSDGRIILPEGVVLPTGDHESRGKGWLEKNCTSYRPTRDQGALTRMVDFQLVREKQLRSFKRLEHSVEELLEAVAKDQHISAPIGC